MTNPTPAPTTRERELFDKLASDIYNRQGLGDEWQAIDDEVMNNELMPDWLAIFAAALARERREGMERACACVCDLCRISVPEIHRGEWCHRVGKRDYRLCEAASIRAKMDTPATE